MDKNYAGHEIFMRRCLQLAKFGCYDVAPNPMVGAVLVDSQGRRVLSQGWHRHIGGPHAEVECIREAQKRGITDFAPMTLYVSLEPCSHYGKTPPCTDLIIEKKIRHVVIGMKDPNPLVAGNGIRKLQEAGIIVEVGVLESECRELNKRFICYHEKKRPYVILKWAQSVDGFLDVHRNSYLEDRNSSPVRISTLLTKRVVHKMRAENMAILIGSNTALLDNPHLINRKWVGNNPIRILLDRRRRVPANFNLFSADVQTIVYDSNTEWSFVLSDLYGRNIHSVLVEGGARVLNTILESGIWDEVHVEIGRLPLHDGVSAPPFPMLYHEVEKMDNNSLYTFFNNN